MEHPKYLEQQFLNERTADVIFNINTGKGIAKFPAHKVILAASSKVFDNRFNEIIDLKQIEINYVSPAAFREFLYTFYSKQPEKNFKIENIVSILDLARVFDFGFCTSTCEQFLVNSLTDDALLFGYSVAIQFQLNSLKQHCQRKVNMRKITVLTSKKFFDCNEHIFYELVRNLADFHQNEVVLVWDACLYWIQVESGKRQVNIKDYLDFLSKTFSGLVSEGGDFQTYAKKHYEHLLTSNALVNLQLFQTQFKNPLVVVRLLQTMLATQICSTNDAIEIELKCTKKIILTGIAFATVSGSPCGKLKVSVRRDNDVVVLAEQNLTSKLKLLDKPKNFVGLDAGIILEPNQTYIARVILCKDVVFYRSYSTKNHFVQKDFDLTFACSKSDIFSHFFFNL